MSLARNQGAKINNFDSLLCPWLHERWYYPVKKGNGTNSLLNDDHHSYRLLFAWILEGSEMP